MQTVGGATPLMYACQQGRETDVLNILKRQPNSVRERDRTLKTALHYCAENRNINCAEAILKMGPELVNTQDENGYSSLHLAVIAGNKPLIKLLLDHGADLNVSDHEGHSPVHWAVVSSEREALEMIIRAGAKPSTPDVHGGYPLHYAVQMCGSQCDFYRHLEDTVKVVETLLNFGVDVNVKDKDGRQPILWAASAGSSDAIIHLISGGACVEAADKDGLTALHCAASRGHFTTLETLVTLCGANVDVIDGNGCSALFYSVTLGHADATELLLRLGSEPNRQDRKGRTPAHCGAAKGQLETLKILEKHNGNLWLRNVKGDLPLHEAVASGRKDLVLWLLSQNPEAVNVANNDGRYPIHIACMYNNTEMVKVLLDSKSLVNPVMRTSKGVLMTPLNVALLKGHRSCGKYLQLHGGVPFSKVSAIEPTSVFAVRISPSDDGVNKLEALTPPPVVLSTSKTSTDGQVEKIESYDKKKVYRRRKKRKNSSNADKKEQGSDSEDSNIELKVPGKESRRSGKVEEGLSDSNKNLAKTRSNGRNIRSTSSSRNPNGKIKVDKKKEIVEENITKNLVGARTDSKVLRRNKSFNETKNISDLSPEDFPPLMQSINKLDSGMLETEIDVNKLLNESDESLKPLNKEVVPEKEQLIEVEKTHEEKEVEVNKKIKKEEKSIKSSENQGSADEKDEKSVTSKAISVGISKDEEAAQAKTSKEDTLDESEKWKQDISNSEKPLPLEKKNESESTTQGEKSLETVNNGGNKNKEECKNENPESEAVKGEKESELKEENDVVKVEKEDGSHAENTDEVKESSDVVFLKTASESSFPVPKETSEIVDKVSAEEVVKQSNATNLQVPTIQDNENPASESFKEKIDATKNVAEVRKIEEDEILALKVSDTTNGDTKKSDHDSQPPLISEKRESDGFEKILTPEIQINVADVHATPPSNLQISPLSPDEVVNASEVISAQEMTVLNDATQKHSTDTLGQSGDSTADSISFQKLQAEQQEHESITNDENDKENFSETVTLTTPTVENPTAATTTPEQDCNEVDEKKKNSVKNGKEEGEAETPPKVENSEDQIVEGQHAREGHEGVIKIKLLKKNEEEKEEEVEASTSEGFVEIKENNEWINGCRRHYKPPRVSRLCRRHKDFRDDINQTSITQLVQNTIRKYHVERGIFYQLLELKRMQIRSGKANEQVLVKRLADEYERTRVFAGMKHFSGVYRFREFEKFLYDQLKLLNARRSFIIPEVKSFDDIDALSGILRKSRYKLISQIPESDRICTSLTHRCHHSACAYTSIPCSAYVSDTNHSRPEKQKKECFFPQIHHSPMKKAKEYKTDESPPTLELTQGNEKRVIVLPQNYPDKGKRYYVTFTIKGSSFKDDDGFLQDNKNYFKHRHAKSV